MRQEDGTVVQVYCDMMGGAWNEILRRGADAEKTLIDASEQLPFDTTADVNFEEFYGDLASEFFVGTNQLAQFDTPGLRTELLVELQTVDSEYYFSIFSVGGLNPLTQIEYQLGTAGDGFLHLLDGHTFNPECSEAWFANDCTDLDRENVPRLTRPLDGAPRAGGVFDWPRLEKALERISLKVRVNRGEFCTKNAPGLRLSPYTAGSGAFRTDLSPSITTPAVAGGSTMATNVTITCRDSSTVITTRTQYDEVDYTSQSSTATFHCASVSGGEAAFDDVPLSEAAICMVPCKQDYTLVAPTAWTNPEDDSQHVIDRLTCLSPLREPAGLGPYKAAERCGADGEQLLDFPVPRDRLAELPADVGLLTAMHYSVDPADSEMWIRDLRGTYFKSHKFDSTLGNYKTTHRCVGLFGDPGSASDDPGTLVHQTPCYNQDLRFVCMSTVGCAPDQLWLDGFCYHKLDGTTAKDHMKTCYSDPTKAGGRNGMPAVPTAALLDLLAGQDPPAEPAAVGAYRRHDGFFKMDVAIPDAEINGVEEADLGCAVLDIASKQLSAIDCGDSTTRSVICQYPGLPTDECPTIFHVVYPSASLTGSNDINAVDRVSTITASGGYNYYEREGPHSLEYKCLGLQLDWELQTPLDGLADPDVPRWHPPPPEVLACTTDDHSDYPANSNFSTVDRYLVHRCISPLQIPGEETEQQQSCDHGSHRYTGPVQDCDECKLDPLAVPADLPMNSSWDGETRHLGHQVNYTCHQGLTTTNGTSVQQQTCTLDGWVGEIAPCDTCEWLERFNTSGASVNVSGGLQYGGLVELACLAGLESADGATTSSAVCTPDVWNLCHDNFTCDYCHGTPTNHSELAFVASSDWDGESRHQGTVVTFTCQGTSLTEEGQALQYQNCTEHGWAGQVLSCGVCADDPMDALEAMTRLWNGSRAAGTEASYVCNNGTAEADGYTNQTKRCGPDGWYGEVLPCDTCIGHPPNVTGLTTISSSYSGNRSVGTQVSFTCEGPLTAAGGLTEQTVNCTEHGWKGDVLPCDVCPPPPPGNHSTIRQVVPSADRRLGATVEYRCNHHLYTADGHSHILAVCEPDGWSVCEPEIRCNYCSHLGDVAQYGGTLNWNYTGARELGTVVALECEAGLATPGLETSQTLTCGLGGWNKAVPCSICTEPVPSPPASMKPNVTWTLGDATAIYNCLDTKKLAWGLTAFEMTCTPTGWPCAPPCDYCADTPPPPAGVFPTDVFPNPGGRALFECNSNLQTALNDTVQSLTCAEFGWEGDILPCDQCIGEVIPPSPGQNRAWSGNTTVDTSVIYECVRGKQTADGITYQTRNCTESGWTPQPEPCDLCVPPREPFAYMSRQWDGNQTVNSTASYTCAGNLTTMANETEQTITCTDNGWSDGVRPCALCRGPIPEAGNYTERNLTSWVNWRLPGAVIEYTCYTGAVQTVTCDAGQWKPEVLPPCCESPPPRPGWAEAVGQSVRTAS